MGSPLNTVRNELQFDQGQTTWMAVDDSVEMLRAKRIVLEEMISTEAAEQHYTVKELHGHVHVHVP